VFLNAAHGRFTYHADWLKIHEAWKLAVSLINFLQSRGNTKQLNTEGCGGSPQDRCHSMAAPQHRWRAQLDQRSGTQLACDDEVVQCRLLRRSELDSYIS
jgi:hypothetical protein